METRITVSGKEYPCEATMGAMLRYKEITGEDVSQMKSDEIAPVVTFIYCCTAAGCAKTKVSFELSLMEFADAISIDSIGEITAALMAKASDGSKKKKTASLKA